MNLEKIFRISASGLKANRIWMTVVASNLANANTTRTDDGQPYKRRTVIFEASSLEDGGFRNVLQKENDYYGVKVVDVVPDGRDFRRVYDPSHPDANDEGFVLFPNINPVEEMANLLEAARAYEANMTVVDTSRQMALKALEMGR
ncbi:flagellar basal body rod protein FlgC [Thermodesulforhabdus norvegica]|uniref:Flagellar basal-body rod protein FlgC n=1 Tax=Thermodesulforhabdus norvegica TaxID=39841 RepID=A0A1I4R684_9BACT|nr:flagellar basal body rod protein FlgC [Thermodesulforhabdus norvegica]SFM47824.1 flagellar basal-body rod protein FlgC [Thermodesulforhabdus norvegica]